MIFRTSKPFVLFLFILISNLAPAQPDLISYIQEKHGSDQGLINGILFFNRYYYVFNHPYHNTEDFLPGSVILSGNSYDELQINYNIYSQYLVLEFQGVKGGFYKIILSPEHTDAFHLDGDYFEKLSLDDEGPLFYQVIRVNALSCYIHWEKKMIPRSNDLLYHHTFTDPKRTYFLNYSGELNPFSNKRTFASNCSGVPKKKITKYMRKNGIRFSEASTEQIEGLLMFVYSNLQSTSGN
ncbi:hypothetical protein ACFLTU_08925 [Bacteroidota bacterium]